MHIEPLNQCPAAMVWAAVDRVIAVAEYDPDMSVAQTVDEILMVWLRMMPPAGRG